MGPGFFDGGGTAVTDTTGTDVRWSPATRIGFRFGFCYFGLFGLACFVGLTPVLLAGAGIPLPWSSVAGLLEAVRPLIDWTASGVLGLRIESMQVGSDSAFQWTALFLMLVVSTIATVVWSVLDRHRDNYARLAAWLTLYLRFVLATAMFYFGMAKAIPTQMPFVLNRLVEPFGNFSPQGVLWSQVSISQPYQIALGSAELLAGVLLLIPRAVPAGALLTAIDMTQVFLLNMTYDIRLKTVSSMLLLISLFLLAPYAARLAAVLFSDRAVPAASTPQLFTSARANRIALVAQLLVGAMLFGVTAAQNWQQWARPVPELYGIYRVDGFSAEGYRRDPLLTDELQWRRVIFDRSFNLADPMRLTIQHMDDSFEEYGGTIDASRHFIDLNHYIELGTSRQTPVRVRLTYWWPGPDRLVIDADDYAGHRIHAWCTKVDPNSFPLVERGFSWVRETPYNR
ncbi:DoxX family protein [Mycolicibacterium peregrinum]|uniref:DoxX family protein n=1 Tax=Mycolicibacterium peregrinum TaxID=43304 RepID=UPI000B4A761C|nr:DoxX family protein [Mycolicibacterium peregrinum]MCV7203748.1 DoxX family protein [Mycolicibacterium peregrinum]